MKKMMGFQVVGDGAGGFALPQRCQHGREHRLRLFGVLVPRFGQFGDFHLMFFGAFQIGQHQFRFDGVDIPQGIHRSVNVRHITVFETAHDVDDGVNLSDVAEELVAQPLAFAGAFHQTRDVHKGDLRGNNFLGPRQLGQRRQPTVRHPHFALIGLDGAKGVIGRLRRLRLR